MDVPYTSSLSRRDLLKLGGAAVAAGAAGSGLPLVFPAGAAAQVPKRGGTFRIRCSSGTRRVRDRTTIGRDHQGRSGSVSPIPRAAQ